VPSWLPDDHQPTYPTQLSQHKSNRGLTSSTGGRELMLGSGRVLGLSTVGLWISLGALRMPKDRATAQGP
jgi:hypothetical protein